MMVMMNMFAGHREWNTVGISSDISPVAISRVAVSGIESSSFASSSMTYWPAGGGRGQNPENTAQGHSGHNSICP